MSAPAVVGVDRPTLRIRGTTYPVLLPTLRDPRLHLAAVIVSLQVLGQVAFDFQLSIAQILVSLAVAGILEVTIAFFGQRVIMWPASALLTGNGVAFVLRVPGTEHGDWWSMNGWWIFAGTSAIALLSKYLVRVRGRHIFNPSNFGLVLCFLLLGAERADPLALWWGPLSPALVLALVLIVVGGFLILRRLHLVGIAVGFWLAFAAGIGVLAASGHTMTAAWHVGPIEGARVLVAARLLAGDPRLPLLHDHGPEDDPGEPQRTPRLCRRSRSARDAADRAADDRVRDEGRHPRRALRSCARREGVVELVGAERLARAVRRRLRAATTRRGRRGARRRTRVRRPRRRGRDPGAPGLGRRGSDRRSARSRRSSSPSAKGVAPIDDSAAQAIARDVLADLRLESDALRGARSRPRRGGGERRMARVALGRDPGAGGGRSRSPATTSSGWC